MIYKLPLPLHLQPLHHPNMKYTHIRPSYSSGQSEHAKRRNPCTGPKDFGMYEGTRGHAKQRRTTPHEQPRGLECKSRCKNS